MFKLNKENGWYDYWESTVLPSGQTVKIEFQEDETKKKLYYSIYLVTMDKRKSEAFTVLHTTGKDGLQGLLWAKEKIIEFEKFILDEPRWHDRPIIMYCSWDDNRRRDIYHRGLKSIGYDYGVAFGRKVLLKQIS